MYQCCKAFTATYLDAVNDRLDVICFSIQLGLADQLGPGCNLAADVTNCL